MSLPLEGLRKKLSNRTNYLLKSLIENIKNIPKMLVSILGQAVFADAIEPASTDAENSMSADAGTDEHPLPNFFFSEGAPKGGASFCLNFQNPFFKAQNLESLCQEFYVTASKKVGEEVLIQGAYSISTISERNNLEFFRAAVKSCGAEILLKKLYEIMLEKIGSGIFGSNTCQSSIFSSDKLVNINYLLAGVSDEFCSGLLAGAKEILQPCMDSKIDPDGFYERLRFVLKIYAIMIGCGVAGYGGYVAYRYFRPHPVPPPLAPPPVVMPPVAGGLIPPPPALPGPPRHPGVFFSHPPRAGKRTTEHKSDSEKESISSKDGISKLAMEMKPESTAILSDKEKSLDTDSLLEKNHDEDQKEGLKFRSKRAKRFS